MTTHLATVVELPEFQRRAKALLSDEERVMLIDVLAADPQAGVSLGGGLRKFRWARPGSGKSGGFRVVHFLAGMGGPVFLLTIFAKNEKANLTAAEQARLIDVARLIAST